MTDSKKTPKTEVRAGVSEEEEKDVRALARETADNEAAPPSDVSEDAHTEAVEGLLSELPEDGIAAVRAGQSISEEGEVSITPTTLNVGEATAPTFADQFHGIGGSYVIDPDTGERKRQYEEVFNEKGKSLGFRPAP